MSVLLLASLPPLQEPGGCFPESLCNSPLSVWVGFPGPLPQALSLVCPPPLLTRYLSFLPICFTPYPPRGVVGCWWGGAVLGGERKSLNCQHPQQLSARPADPCPALPFAPLSPPFTCVGEPFSFPLHLCCALWEPQATWFRHLKCGKSKLRCAVGVKYIPDFADSV